METSTLLTCNSEIRAFNKPEELFDQIRLLSVRTGANVNIRKVLGDTIYIEVIKRPGNLILPSHILVQHVYDLFKEYTLVGFRLAIEL